MTRPRDVAGDPFGLIPDVDKIDIFVAQGESPVKSIQTSGPRVRWATAKHDVLRPMARRGDRTDTNVADGDPFAGPDAVLGAVARGCGA